MSDIQKEYEEALQNYNDAVKKRNDANEAAANAQREFWFAQNALEKIEKRMGNI